MTGARAGQAFRAVLVLALTVLAAACASTNSGIRPAGNAGNYRIGQPYEVNGVRYVPREQPGYDETGIASWYGPGFHGKLTADGEIYDQNGISAAHATLPLPVSVRVTNLDNGRSLVVRVNDRGPFHDSRIIDLSAKAADLLGFRGAGTARVRVQYLGPAITEPEMAIADASAPTRPSRPTPSSVKPQQPPAPQPTAPTPPPSATPAPAADQPVIAMAPIPNDDDGTQGTQPATATEPAPDATASQASNPSSETPPATMAPIPNPPEAKHQVVEASLAPSIPNLLGRNNNQGSTLDRAEQIAAAAASLLVSPAHAETVPTAPTTELRPSSAGPARYYVQVGTFSQSTNAEALYNDVRSFGALPSCRRPAPASSSTVSASGQLPPTRRPTASCRT